MSNAMIDRLPDVATAMREAKAARRRRHVIVHGADVAQSPLRESLLDVLRHADHQVDQ